MTQGDIYFVTLVIAALTVFASAVAYGSWIAPGTPVKAAESEKPADRHAAASDSASDVRKAA